MKKLAKSVADMWKVTEVKTPWAKELGVYFERFVPLKDADVLVCYRDYEFPNGEHTLSIGYARLKKGIVIEVAGDIGLLPHIGQKVPAQSTITREFLKPIPKKRYVAVMKAWKEWREVHVL